MKTEEIRHNFERIAQKVFEASGEYDAEVMLNCENSALTRFANNVIHQNLAVENNSLRIRLQKGRRDGAVNVSLFADEREILEAVEKAKQIIQHSADSDEVLPMLGPQNYREISRFCEKTASLSPEDRANMVAEAVARCEEKNLSAAGIVENSAGVLGIANSKGLFAFWNGTNFTFSITMFGENGTGWAESLGWSIDRTNVPSDIAEAIDIALKNQNPRDIAPGKYTVVLTPAAVGDLVSFMAVYGFNARTHLEKRSFLAGKIGQKVFDEKITIVDDAYHEAYAGLPFDFEGVPRQKVVLVENGVLKNLVADRWTAEKMKIEPTGHGLPKPNHWGAIPANIVISPGETSMEDMIKSVKRGLLITHFHYTNVSELTRLTITGMTRDGVFMIENGEIAYPVKNLRFTQPTTDTFNKVLAVGDKPKLVAGFFFGGAYTPAMLVEDFNFSSATEFGG
ncbi:TldD/PmbA family protein [bacterium]|nr:TldD/PmbA family protein [bacterium]